MFGRHRAPIAATLLGALLSTAAPIAEGATPRGMRVPQQVEGTLAKAPPSFGAGQLEAVFVDVLKSAISLEIDTRAWTAKGRAEVLFEQARPGAPVIDLVPEPTQLIVDGARWSPSRYRVVETPAESTRTRILDRLLQPGRHTMRVDYTWKIGAKGYQDGIDQGDRPFGFAFTMNDYRVGGRGFFERYGPANYEFDQHPTSLKVRLRGCESCQVFANGEVRRDAGGSFVVEFPAHFNASAPFLSIVDPAITEIRTTHFTSIDGRQIPVRILIENPESTADGRKADAEVAERAILEALALGERFAGPYPQSAFLLHQRPADLAGMEYAGAALIAFPSPWIIRHEVFHSWFARGMMPADGAAGPLDEALVHALERLAEGAAPFPPAFAERSTWAHPHQRHTTNHTLDPLLHALDQLLAVDGGLAARLPALMSRFNRRTITLGDFQAFLKESSAPARHAEIDAQFDRLRGEK